DTPIDDAFWSARVRSAVRRRDALLADGSTTACRLVHAEADFLPGLIIDRYADVVVVQFLAAGVDRVRNVVLDALLSAAAPAAIFERSDTSSRVRERLRKFREQGRRFDLVVLDPPRFATNRHQLDNALRAYKDINRVALEVLSPGGVLATFSCSQAVDAAAFTMAVAWAGLDAGR